MSFRIGDGDFSEIIQAATILMGNHLVLFANNEYSATLWVVDLRDISIYHKCLSRFGEYEGYSLNNYGEDQIIKFGGQSYGTSTNCFLWITIDSFKRKL